MSLDSPLVAVMNTVAESLQEPGSLETTLSHITQAAMQNVPGADLVSISSGARTDR